jgi:acyl dehydratase
MDVDRAGDCDRSGRLIAPTIHLADLPAWVGGTLAPSEWIAIDQARIDGFAACTDDHQFIHVDPARAARETPFGGTIAHGFLLLSLIGGHPPADFPFPRDMAVALNYGLDTVRFLSPVRAGSRVRLHTKILEVREKDPGRWLLRQEKTLEIEGIEAPALVVQSLVLLIAAPPT